MGKVTEHFIPFLPEFDYNPQDARFIGSPVDFVVFDGLSEGDLRQVVFMEVKSGKAALSTRERWIRDAVREGRVLWQQVRTKGGKTEIMEG
jgi:predicted Holliday junction resolvase-like endonuclease